MKWFPLFWQLFFPPRCAACGRLQLPRFDGPSPVLCPNCRRAWESARVLSCPNCFAAYGKCDCMPSAMKRARVNTFVKLAPYTDEGWGRIVKQLIGNIKRRRAKYRFTFLAAALAPEVTRALLVSRDHRIRSGQEMPPVVVSHVPRSRKTRKQYGFDQSAKLAGALAKKLRLPHRRLLSRRHDGVAQKGLNFAQRQVNMRDAFTLKRSSRGHCVILVDDVVTSGASMSAAAKLLRKGGAVEVIAVSIARTEKKVAEK